MRVQVSDPAFVYALVCSLRRDDWIAAQAEGDTLVVVAPRAPTEAEARRELDHHLLVWRTRHPGVSADVVSAQRPSWSTSR